MVSFWSPGTFISHHTKFATKYKLFRPFHSKYYNTKMFFNGTSTLVTFLKTKWKHSIHLQHWKLPSSINKFTISLLLFQNWVSFSLLKVTLIGLLHMALSHQPPMANFKLHSTAAEPYNISALSRLSSELD